MPGKAFPWYVEKLLFIADLVWICFSACCLPERQSKWWCDQAILHHNLHLNDIYYSFFSSVYLSHTTSLQDRVALLFFILINEDLRYRNCGLQLHHYLAHWKQHSGYSVHLWSYKSLTLNICITYVPTPLSLLYIHKGLRQSSRKFYFSY